MITLARRVHLRRSTVNREAPASIAYYITAHGYGHGVRSCSIINAFADRWPDIPVAIISDLPESFLRNRLASDRHVIRAASFDVGMVQLDSIRVDVRATLTEAATIHARGETLIAGERRVFDEENIGMVVADIPALPIEAAYRHGLPRLAVGNFAWNWIYSAFVEQDPRWKDIVEQLEEGYGKTDLLLRLPFSEEMKIFPRVEDLPLVAEPGCSRRDDIAALTGADPGKKWILLSFTTLEWDEAALGHVSGLRDYEFFTVKPLQWAWDNLFPIDRDEVPFIDVIATCDAVVSKPGFGILSECVVNRKPLVHVEREDFIEYPILLRAVQTYLKHCYLPADHLYRGELEKALASVWDAPEPTASLSRGGARVAAQRMAECWSRSPRA